ncbi:MAG TPA: alpha/beta hydrolase [Solirubrobacteraceae bacterium]|nr:alpha/beta hydrolase [Solirubrobacteraceae bacterium]
MGERRIEGAGVLLGTEEAGEGIPVVLVHGLTATRHYVVMGSKWLERNGHRVIAYDARGHGTSAPAPDPEAYGYDALSDDLAAVLDAFEVERAVLAGASMGAHTLLAFALAHPERVAAIVAVTPAYDPATADDADRLARWHDLAEGLRRGGVEGFMEAFGRPDVPAQMLDTVLTVQRQRLGRHEHPEAVADALDVVPRSRPFDDLQALGAIEAPAVVVASRDDADAEHPLEVGEAYARAIPGARLEVEERGKSPLAWQGGQLSRVIAEAAAAAG